MALLRNALVVVFALTAISAPIKADPEAEEALRLLVKAEFDWNHYLEIQSTENSFVGQTPYYSQVSVSNDIWLLRQKEAGSDWGRFGFVIRDGKAYFAKLDANPRLIGSKCMVCHANGPRALRGIERHGTQADFDRFNATVRAVGLVRAYYPPQDPPHDTRALALTPCANCHDGVRRSRLTRENVGTIRFQLSQHTMPPNDVLTDADLTNILEWAK